MDYGLIIILIVFIVYYAFQYKKHKKVISLIMVYFFIWSMLYSTKYPIYDGLQQSNQKNLNICFIIFTLILLFVGYINRIKKSS
jgi:hypothetical protein